MNQSRRHDTIALAILATLATLLFIDVLVGSSNFYMRDLTRYYYPTKQVLREIVLGGEFPWWNRLFAAGQPIAANPEHEVFYPLTWLILLPSYDLGYRLHILVHIYIGLFGMYAMLRSMDLRAPAASFGAISFALGGIYLSYINLLPILFCVAWLPLTCLYVRRYMLKPTLRSFALSSLFLGMQFLVAEPTTVMQTGFVIGMYALYRGWYAAKDAGRGLMAAIPEMFSRVVFIGLISLAAMAVGAAQMFPAIDHVGASARSRTFDFWLVSAWSMPWAKLAELFYPNFLGHISIDQVMWYWGGGLYPGMGSPFLFSIYPGLLVTGLVLGAVFVRPRGGRFVLILCTFSLLLALGSHTPLLRWLYEAGIATSIRYPEKFMLIALFAAIVFAAQLFQRLLDGDEVVRESTLGFAAAAGGLALVIALLTLTPQYRDAFEGVWGQSGAGVKKMLEISSRGWWIAALRGAVLFLLVWHVRDMPRKAAVILFAAFVVADLGPVVHELNPRMPSRFFTTPPEVLQTIKGDKTRFRIFHEVDWYGQESAARRYFSTGKAVYWIVRNGLYPMTPAGHGVAMVLERDYDKTALLPTIDLTDSLWDVKRSGRADWWQPFVAMSNARYRTVYKPFEVERLRVLGRMERAISVDFVDVGENPRYYFADQMVSIFSRHDFSRKLSRGNYSRNVAFVEGNTFTPSKGVVHRWSETANSARIEVESSGRGFLVMSVTPHKWWRVEIDGRRAEARVTNVGYQGIEVPPGRHVVTMRYRNDIAVIGMFVSATALLLLGGALLFAARRSAG